MNRYIQRFKTTEEKFWEKVDKHSDDECWEWIGAKSKGYGDFWDHGRIKAHRYSWKLHNGKINNGLFVLHKCDNRACVNPNHLFLGNNRDNMIDMIQKGRGKFTYGEKQPNSKLTPQNVLEIRKLYNNKEMNLLQLSNKFGVCFQQISRIVNGQRWTHI